MAIFKKSKAKKAAIATSAPEEPETPGEIKHIEELNSSKTTDEELTTHAEESVPEINYREVPVCMSQSQINNLIIENNIMLKQIISEI